MREGNFEVLLIGSNRKFEENEGFILAESGTEYSICVRVYKDETSGKWPFKSSYVKVGCFVDGIDVNYWKRIDFSTNRDNFVDVSFWGFKQDVQTVKAFVFSVPKATALGNQSTSDENISLGQIRVVFFEAEPVAEVFTNSIPSSTAPTSHFISDSKKFWQQASLTTTSGRSIEKESFKPISRWNNLHKDPNKTVIVNYHTSDMFHMMKKFEAHESQTMQSSMSSSSSSNQRTIVDLSNDSEEDETSTSSKSRNNVFGCEEQEKEEEVIIIPIIKHVPMLDISGEDEVWSAVRIESNTY